jgi:hypothetical protein
MTRKQFALTHTDIAAHTFLLMSTMRIRTLIHSHAIVFANVQGRVK